MSEWKTTYRGIVYPWHCDHMGHMNVMWYAGKFAFKRLILNPMPPEEEL